MSTTEILNKHGIHASNVEECAAALEDLKTEELTEIVGEFFEKNVPVNGDETIQSLALKYALLAAFENGATSISPDEFDEAHQKAMKVAVQIGDESETTESKSSKSSKASKSSKKETQTQEEEYSEEEEYWSSYDIVQWLVENDPDAQRSDIIEQAAEYEVAESTAGIYYYTARSELGLPPIGKRGRKPTGVHDQVAKLIKSMRGTAKKPKVDRDTIKTAIAEEFDLAESTATVYYYRGLKNLGLDA